MGFDAVTRLGRARDWPNHHLNSRTSTWDLVFSVKRVTWEGLMQIRQPLKTRLVAGA
jgi:hypothetical protein